MLLFVLLLLLFLCARRCYIWWQRWDADIFSVRKDSLSPVTAPREPGYHVSLPEFTGTNIPVDEWVRKVYAVQRANGWTDKKLLGMLPTGLSGRAIAVFDKAVGKSLERVFIDITTAFKPSTKESQNASFAIRWDGTERFDEYAVRVEEAFNSSTLHSMDSVTCETLQRFVEGLPQQYKLADSFV